MAKWLSTRFSAVTRGANKQCKITSAIDAAGYISREELYSEYDGHTYKPDPKEDLVHSEIDLPENAPEEYKDRATLWNSFEALEKQKNIPLYFHQIWYNICYKMVDMGTVRLSTFQYA